MYPPQSQMPMSEQDPSQGLQAQPVRQYSDTYLLDMFSRLKKEDTEYRWIWEREWLRDLYYVANRQWITFHPTRREWVDKRLQKWVPRPVTNKMAETLQAIRTNLGASELGVKARPVGNNPQSISAADVSDKAAPLIHQEHTMNQVMRESDFWMICTGNACLQLSWDKDKRFNRVFVPYEQCLQCGAVLPPDQIVQAGQSCPQCGSTALMKAMKQNGQQEGDWVAFGKGKTTALSPFEYAVPPNVTRWDELPRITRLRWRDKQYYEVNHPELVGKLIFEKSPSDRSLQIFKSLALSNDVGTGSQFSYLSAGGAHTVEGITEYEMWIKPTHEFPEGFVMRVAGDTNPVLIHAEDEGIPGPMPYKDIDGNPLFPFVHAQYEHMGGRLYGRSALSPLIQKQDQINQLDSLIQLIVQRTANPVWVIPENAGIENLTGEPGLIVKWNVLAAQGHGKPERVAGMEIQSSLFALREQYIKDIEDLSGAFDIIKGQKPSGVEAFSALQLLVERSQSRFTSVFQARGEMYRAWYSLALELERQFGPEQRTWAVLGSNRGYTWNQFENAQLQGQVSIHIEDGIKLTSLAKRAAIEQANQLRLLDPADTDQRYALMSSFGLADLAPSLDLHVQSALQIQDAFETWVKQPQGPSPLVVKPWFDLQLHWNERIKWLNQDRMRELVSNPQIEAMIIQHLTELQMAMMPPPMPGEPEGAPGAAGGGQAMSNSNSLSGSTGAVPKGNAQRPNEGQQMGPM